MNKFNMLDAILCIYGFMFIITFGHMWVKMMPFPVGPFPPELMLVKMIFTLIGSFGWPLYWSIWIWS